MRSTRQAGIHFRFGDILRHQALMERARDAAIAFAWREGIDRAVEVAGKLLPRGFRILERD